LQVLSIATSQKTTSQLSFEYGVSVCAINNIRTGRFWSKVTGIKYNKKYRRYLSPDEVLSISSDTGSCSSIAKKYSIGPKTVSSIHTGRHYSKITKTVL